MANGIRSMLSVLGFEKLDKAEKDYLHEANMRMCGYMGVIVVLLEAWMLVRQTWYKIIPKYEAGEELFGLAVKYTSKYWLFLLIGLGLTLFCIFCRNKKLTRGRFITLMTVGCACILYTGMLGLEAFTQPNDRSNPVITPVMAGIMNATLVSIYVFLFLTGATIVTYTWFRYKKNRNIVALEHLVIIWFNMVCLAFGIYVSYSDFWVDKEIICFLTMVVYVGCLLVYRPYLTLISLGLSFWGFHRILLTFQGGLSFAPNETVIRGVTRFITSGDTVNYITFFVSLTTIGFAIYHGRLSEARKNSALEKTARNDSLTGLYSFSYFSALASEHLQNAPASLGDFIFLFFDIHNFKAFNEQRGFEAGDRFLSAVGRFISGLFPDSLCAREADDHFTVLARPESLAEKLDALNRMVHDYDSEILLGINCGGYRPAAPDEDPRTAIDKARYAVQSIRSRFQVIYAEYDEAMSKAYHRRLYIINNIDNAVANGWIVPYYQPVVWSDTREVCGCEALARWMDPVYGQLFPNEFIPVLEDSRLIHRLDRSIFRSACRDLRSSLDAGEPVFPVSLNFSRLDFELMDAIGELENCVREFRIPRDLIHVEVTESALADNFQKLHESIIRIKEMGYSLWLDDFGSAYSSLNVLKDYDFDVVKIDMRFLSGFDTNEKSKDLLDCVVRLADRVHMKTVSEGVETEAQAAFLQQIGCGRLQGYLFGKPVPRKDLYQSIKSGELKVSPRT